MKVETKLPIGTKETNGRGKKQEGMGMQEYIQGNYVFHKMALYFYVQ